MAHTLLSIYPQSSARYDEMLAAGARVRPHWQPFISHIDAATPEQMRHRLDFVSRTIQENGIAYNVYADPKGTDRPWELDPLPLIIAADEWQSLAAAVAQRATLLNAVLGDLYGPQQLLASGLLPPALVFGHGGYLWPARGVRSPDDVYLHFYAVDLARSPDGHWWVIADRTQAPSGAGYSLENRLIVSRVFPELFRDLHVQHLASFFQTLQDSLAGWANCDAGEKPVIVLLTPGPYNETYFEHAYLSRYLGFPLVEGQDLTVRGDTVYLKTLTGLKRVHVIVRRQDDDFCDPLELRGDSALGVPGLLQAVRAGRVLVSNALGSGVVESGALLGFLPAVCERLLGEKLRLPSVATWWCGEKPALEYTCAHLDQLVIKPAFPSRRLDIVFGQDLRGPAREEMLQRLRQRPHDYVAQELVNLSQAPIWSRNHDRRLLARPVGLRLYAVATPNGYAVMPGGLSRVAGNANDRIISMQRGGSSKDTWVLTDGPVSTFSLLKPSISASDVARNGRTLSSRVIENLFWLGRYTERCDDIARLLRAALGRFIDAGAGGGTSPSLAEALRVTMAMGVVPLDTASGLEEKAEDAAQDSGPAPSRPLASRLVTAIIDEDWATGLAANLRRMQWTATQVRERLSLDHWHAINRLLGQLQEAREPGEARDSGTALAELLLFIDQALLSFASQAGFTMDNMTRDAGWRLHVVGRRLERLSFLATAIAGFLREAPSQDGLEWLLELADSTITYRSRYVAKPELLPVIDLLVLDDSNPHAVLFQAIQVDSYLEMLNDELGGSLDIGLSQHIGRLRLTDLRLFEGGNDYAVQQAARLDLVVVLFELAAAAQSLSDRIGMRYFSHVGNVSRQVVVA